MYLDLLIADLSFVLNSVTLLPASLNARAVSRCSLSLRARSLSDSITYQGIDQFG